jgi:hypothetical protein
MLAVDERYSSSQDIGGGTALGRVDEGDDRPPAGAADQFAAALNERRWPVRTHTHQHGIERVPVQDRKRFKQSAAPDDLRNWRAPFKQLHKPGRVDRIIFDQENSQHIRTLRSRLDRHDLSGSGHRQTAIQSAGQRLTPSLQVVVCPTGASELTQSGFLSALAGPYSQWSRSWRSGSRQTEALGQGLP